MRIHWREVFKFLSGAFFVSAGTNWYFFLLHTAVPLPFPILGFTEITPAFLGLRSLIHSALFFATLYFGFIRKPPVS